MNRRWVLVAAIVIVALIGVWWWRSRSAGTAPKYRTAEVDRGTIESLVSATGTVQPVVQVEVGSQVSGTVSKLGADYNSRVHAGQVLLQIEQSSFRARLVQAEAAVARATASMRDGERSLSRAQELFKQSYVSQADLDAATVALEQRRADLKQAQATLEAAQVDLDHTTIRAPIDGVVISRSIDLGQTVAASLQAPKLFVIANDLSHMQVETRIDEADIGQMRPGLTVTFTVDAFPDREFRGQVAQVRLEPIIDQGVVTYTTVIQTANPEMLLRPGMTANVSVRLARQEDVLRVPNAALRFRPAPSGGGAGRGALAATAPPSGSSGSDPRAGSGGARMPGTSAPSDSARGRQAMGRGGMPTMSDEQRPAWRARMANATPQERQRMRDSIVTVGGGSGGALPGGGRMAGGSAAPGADLIRRGPAGQAGRGLKTAAEPGGSGAVIEPSPPPPAYRPGVVFLLSEGKPERLMVLTGITDGSFTEVQSDKLKPGDKVIVGMDVSTRAASLQPPPGMGGPTFRGPGGGGGGRR